MRDADQLISTLHRLDANSYGAYKRLRDDVYDYGDFTLEFTRIQSDPYAPPSGVRVRVPLDVLALPDGLVSTEDERVAAADHIARRFARVIAHTRDIALAPLGQEILERSSCRLDERGLELRFQVHLPARGRRILGHQAARLFDLDVPDAVFAACDFAEAGEDARRALTEHVHCYVDYLTIRATLAERNWVAFVADDAVLARASGISDAPMEGAVAFASPESTRVHLDLPHAGTVTGMGIPAGVTVIVGGGYHGKSTLLAALERAVYAHIPGDGRERCATDPDAMKIRAEDGRAIRGTDISLFIDDLPGGADTSAFSTDNASGSTSQAASIAEAIEAGGRTLLIDEDTSATNLMIRDARMRELVQAEPITPLVDRIRLLSGRGISSVLVMGGSGDYLAHADLVLGLDTYRVSDLTARAHDIAGATPIPGEDRPGALVRDRAGRACPAPRHGKRRTTKAMATRAVVLDRTSIDISAIAQIVDPGQAEAIAWALRRLTEDELAQHATVREAVDAVAARTSANLDSVSEHTAPAFLVAPRRVDIAAALSRYRGLLVR
ncbi:ABC-ATPase domain-containing protein [Nanchangia anserum]|uniref:ABC-ATPase domain-containing protein n=1 Tax=Nanchangia anserum TaxID=2692125 RepID=A0A8I0GBS3_9ACTO|nr:ABC-ATPase domain-containing protein [Nanchangia anserum]MBD3689371.1 ABC-ATPase domain-containing protein [Nanchangia anserum]QOX81578.1 ABC-ATPase domain-containing protein [Nanchangia anserum]